MSSDFSLLELTEALIRFRSSEDCPSDLRACADFIERYFEGTSLTVERFEEEGVPSVVVTKGTKTPRIFLSGHFDVVPGNDEQFTPRQDGARLYGRGALDMKSGDAVLMKVMKDLADTSHDIGLMLTGDEEVGGFHGTDLLLRRGYSCEAVMIPDGGESVEKCVKKAKGILQIRLSTQGKAAHGSLPWEGKNAIDHLLVAIRALQEQFVPLSEHPQDHWIPTCNIGKIVGGDATNRVPDFAFVQCDIRYTERDSPDRILTEIKTRMPEGVVIETLFSAPLVCVLEENIFVRAYDMALRKEGYEPLAVHDHGSSDGRFFAQKGIPVLMSQPHGSDLHGPNEWVEIESIYGYYRVIRSFLDGLEESK